LCATTAATGAATKGTTPLIATTAAIPAAVNKLIVKARGGATSPSKLLLKVSQHIIRKRRRRSAKIHAGDAKLCGKILL
jgi:hypothetical protein